MKLTICFTAVYARHPRSAEGRVRDYLLNQANYSSKERPVLNSDDAVHVVLSMQLFAMLDLNERDEIVTTASWLNLAWRDERLTWTPQDFNNTDLVTMYAEEIWTPQIFLLNSLDSFGSSIASSNQGQILLTSEGNVLYGAPFIQASQCHMSIRYFPFDIQGCPLTFIPGNELAENIYITTELSRYQSSIKNSEWDLINITSHNYFYNVSHYISNRPVAEYTTGCLCMFFKRDPRYYITTLIIPSSLLCIMSMATFLAPPDSGERISLSVSMVLGLTVFQLLVADTLPTASKESPIVSTYLTINFVLACLTIPSSLANIGIAYGDCEEVSTCTKYSVYRNLFLEYLPRLLCVPTYRERIKCASVDVGTSNVFAEDIEMKAIVSISDGIEDKRKVHPVDSPTVKQKLSNAEKVGWTLFNSFICNNVLYSNRCSYIAIFIFIVL
ncbi:Neuronal acetylcholine receptor subunit alpha-10 [Holothuria leucospilota]|uniref:Neuronal acetylcholine receptor subunit alpha-10 n=1 Tax=Holothuria leucospilota TaxID=206669 RepID=A0A9Q1BEC3_HOLLE|nr:Neuronal acetylcholine receptor subunit alpha-10 [Holothuria leucospilota]